ncbi:ead/Ea22-like family protein [Salmonella enterica subsp. enterica]|nr:hypothetical protein [Salmonella enterica subsp. salamae]ECQ0824977.1 ead/Ea22-like family protein [Salmonella enterica subsp. enterica serovar Newport]ECY3829031.1 ead/Ea22-like family protein [Salmonella enterica subsp. enterica serovar Senftenberg]
MTDKQALRVIAVKTKIAGEAPVMPLEQRLSALDDFRKHFTPETVLALLDELEATHRQVGELTMWVKRLAYSLRNARPNSKLHYAAMDYLSRKGLISVEDVLR